MARTQSKSKPRPRVSHQPPKDQFDTKNVEYVDYKDVELLKRFINEQGKILPRPYHRRNGEVSATAYSRNQACKAHRPDAVRS